MKSVTWAPGTNTSLDQLFDHLREQQYENTNHRLWKNYSKDDFANAVALTIVFNGEGPEMCSSIASKDCWPTGAYRILNRLWKVDDYRKTGAPGTMSPSFGYSAMSQIEWLNKNIDCKLYFISRETDNWEHWVARQFAKKYNIEFTVAEGKFLTCPNECDDTCWQRIIYNGDRDLLTEWKQKV